MSGLIPSPVFVYIASHLYTSQAKLTSDAIQPNWLLGVKLMKPWRDIYTCNTSSCTHWQSSCLFISKQHVCIQWALPLRNFLRGNFQQQLPAIQRAEYCPVIENKTRKKRSALKMQMFWTKSYCNTWSECYSFDSNSMNNPKHMTNFHLSGQPWKRKQNGTGSITLSRARQTGESTNSPLPVPRQIMGLQIHRFTYSKGVHSYRYFLQPMRTPNSLPSAHAYSPILLFGCLIAILRQNAYMHEQITKEFEGRRYLYECKPVNPLTAWLMAFWKHQTRTL